METEQLLQTWTRQLRELTGRAGHIRNYPADVLTWRPVPESWNILECLEHLNRYGDFYLPRIEQGIERFSGRPCPKFRSGWLGGYFAQSMLPGPQLKRMNTFRDKNPLNSNLERTVIDTFLGQLQTTMILVEKSKVVNLNKVRIPTSISALIRLKLGDTISFLINHMQRHLEQIGRIETQLGLHRQGREAV